MINIAFYSVVLISAFAVVSQMYKNGRDIIRNMLRVFVFIAIVTTGIFMREKFLDNQFEHLEYYLGTPVRDDSSELDTLQSNFLSKIHTEKLEQGDGARIASNDGYGWEMVYISPESRAVTINVISPQGERSENIAGQVAWINTSYYSHPYLLLSSFPGELFIYNVVTKKFKRFDARTLGCKSANVTDVAYENGVLYTKQFKEWSACSGTFKSKVTLDF